MPVELADASADFQRFATSIGGEKVNPHVSLARFPFRVLRAGAFLTTLGRFFPLASVGQKLTATEPRMEYPGSM
jgi:hypothetical protein